MKSDTGSWSLGVSLPLVATRPLPTVFVCAVLCCISQTNWQGEISPLEPICKFVCIPECLYSVFCAMLFKIKKIQSDPEHLYGCLVQIVFLHL